MVPNNNNNNNKKWGKKKLIFPLAHLTVTILLTFQISNHACLAFTTTTITRSGGIINPFAPWSNINHYCNPHFCAKPTKKTTTTTTTTTLFQSTTNSNNNNNNNNNNKKKSKGVYARPSAAIERGSGFFVPGLEGSRVRVLFGSIVLLLAFLNHTVGSSSVVNGAQNVSDGVAAFYGVLLLVQAFSEIGRERGFGVDLSSSSVSVDGEELNDSTAVKDEMTTTTTTTGGGGMIQSASSLLPNLLTTNDGIDALKWAAASYVALTPATHVLLLGYNNNNDDDSDNDNNDDFVYYSLGDFPTASTTTLSKKRKGAKAALEAVYNSKSGRISIPSNHPASVNLLPEMGRRCVLLQQIPVVVVDKKEEEKKVVVCCFMIGSNQLLPSFTKNDLRWLGRLASYVGSRV